jgi:hypothetical protein
MIRIPDWYALPGFFACAMRVPETTACEIIRLATRGENMQDERDFPAGDETDGAWCPRCGEREEGLDLLIYSMCACCEAEERKFFNDD